MRATNDGRLGDRRAQSLSWAAPLPDFSSMPRATEGPKQRVEWDTRDTMNNRLWSDIQVTGPKAVTSSMLAEHASHGAQTMAPLSSRQDQRTYHQTHTQNPNQSRTEPPPSSVFQNLSLRGFDVENGDVARELRSTVKEDNRFRTEDASTRIAGRTFENQWMSPLATQQIVQDLTNTAEQLRYEQDDLEQDYRAASGPTWKQSTSRRLQ
jgi:hypothetical protein